MDSDVVNFAVVMLIIVSTIAVLAPLTVWFVRSVNKPRTRELPNPLYEQRFDQLQQSVDAIAVEVERIAEAQRFSAKLLKEQSNTAALPR
jgi:hypothetical protein